MKVWQIEQFGLDHLKIADRSQPNPGPHDLLVRVQAVSLNYRDKLVIMGQYVPTRPDLPFMPVSDFCGEVVARGAAVFRFENGDRVIGNFRTTWHDGPAPDDPAINGLTLGGPLPGALAEFILVPETVAVAAPANLSAIEAATLPVAVLTAWFALTESAVLQAEQTVLVQGTGGVALAALQIATALGARVIVTSRHAEKLDKVSALHGAWATIDTTDRPTWADRALELTGGRGVDHILEIIGGDNLDQSVRALAANGQISLIGILQGAEMTFGAVPFLMRRARLQGVSVGHRRALEDLVNFIEKQSLRPVVDQVYGFAEAPAAFAHLDRGPFGKVAIQMEG